jgi:hypothetical protein
MHVEPFAGVLVSFTDTGPAQRSDILSHPTSVNQISFEEK